MPDHRDTSPGEPAPKTSKSHLKRAARERFDLGRRLVELPPAVLDGLPLGAAIRDAVDAARAITSHGARKRQLGFIARLLRAIDPAPLLEALERQQGAARELNARHHRAEAWRARLLDLGDAAVTELADARRDFEPQAIRQLLRNSRREAEGGKPPVSSRRLFKLLRDLDSVAPLPGLDGAP